MSQYWLYLFVFFMGVCIFVPISIHMFINRKSAEYPPAFANKLWHKIFVLIMNYGIAILFVFLFGMYALDLPYVVTDNYAVTEGTITHIYKGAIAVDGRSYDAFTAGFEIGDEVRVHYLPFSKIAPLVEKMDEVDNMVVAGNPQINKLFFVDLGIVFVIADILLMIFLCKCKLKDRPKDRLRVVLSFMMSIIMVIVLVAFICLQRDY